MNRKIIPDHLTTYRAKLKDDERSPATIEKYYREVKLLYEWLDGAELSKAALSRWKEELLAAGLSPATVNVKLAAVGGFLDFMGWRECRVKSLKLQRRVFRDKAREMSREEYTCLLETARRSGKHRLALLMETLCATGIRVSELRYVTLESARQGKAVVRLKGKVRTILFPGKLCKKLLKYAKQQKTASGEIFLTRNGTPLSRKQIWAEMKALCKKAGVEPGKVFPHNLRHLFARVFHAAHRDIAKLADVLGHSSVETTRIYLITSGEEHAKALDSLRLVC